MADRDARYRQQALRAEQRADRWRSIALDAHAALAILSGDPGWIEDLDGEDRDDARGRAEALASRMRTRTR